MTVYVLQRLGAVVLILIAMSLLVFLATHALPSNTAALILGQYSTPETQAALEHKLGLDRAIAGAILAVGQPVAAWRHGAVAGHGTAGRADAVGRLRPIGNPRGGSNGRRLDRWVVGAWRGRSRLARTLARSCGFGVRLSRHLGAGILLGPRADPGVRQHLPSAADLGRRQPGRWAWRLRRPSGAAGGDAHADAARACRAADAIEHGRSARQHVREGGAGARPAGARSSICATRCATRCCRPSPCWRRTSAS